MNASTVTSFAEVPLQRSRHWLIYHPDSIWAEDWRVQGEAITESEARRFYKEDHGLARLPPGTKFYAM